MIKGTDVRRRAFLSVAMSLVAVFLAAAAWAAQVRMDAGLAHPYLLANGKRTTYLKVGLTGLPMADMGRRAPVNVAIVLDRSGSMTGQKIERAKEAAIMAINRLGSEDIVSVVAYDDTVQVLVPATRVSDKDAIAWAIRQLGPGGSTALFAGVSKGAAEVRKFLDRGRVNRVVLLSDGCANVGPSSAEDLGALGASLIREGISVTTLGLGSDYNEDLMVQLARRSDGNHAFIENAEDMARIFNAEFGDILTVAAQRVTVTVTCAPGIRPVRALGREADISGNTVVATLNQLYGNQEKYILIELEVPAGPSGGSCEVARASVSYANMYTPTTDELSSVVGARFTDSPAVVERETRTDIMVSVVEQIANENNKTAMALRDQGRIEDARSALMQNRAYLTDNVNRYNSPALKNQLTITEQTTVNLEGKDWQVQRKRVFKDNDSRMRQQAY